MDSYHPGVSECITEQARAELQLKRAEMRQQYGSGISLAERIRRRREEMASLELVSKTTVPCPGCGVGIAKDGGCNHMQCRSCWTHFCWRCQSTLEGDYYSHFRQGGCTVFSDEDVRRARRMANVRCNGVRQIIREEGAGAATAICPNCRSLHVKDGQNNHVTCSSCKTQFCFLCRARLRGTSGHFNAQHPQHS